MILFTFLILGFLLFFVIFSMKLLNIVKQRNFDHTIAFFRKYLYVIFFSLFIFYILMVVLTGIYLSTYEYIYVLFFKTLIHLLFFIAIFNRAKQIITNLEVNLIFEESNADLTFQIGSYFIYMAIVEIVSGFILSIVNFMMNTTWKEFYFQVNTTITLFFAIGLILLVVSFILRKAIELYNENQLTI